MISPNVFGRDPSARFARKMKCTGPIPNVVYVGRFFGLIKVSLVDVKLGSLRVVTCDLCVVRDIMVEASDTSELFFFRDFRCIFCLETDDRKISFELLCFANIDCSKYIYRQKDFAKEKLCLPGRMSKWTKSVNRTSIQDEKSV
jgi:hypothetical protein